MFASASGAHHAAVAARRALDFASAIRTAKDARSVLCAAARAFGRPGSELDQVFDVDLEIATLALDHDLPIGRLHLIFFAGGLDGVFFCDDLGLAAFLGLGLGVFPPLVAAESQDGEQSERQNPSYHAHETSIRCAAIVTACSGLGNAAACLNPSRKSYSAGTAARAATQQ